MKSKSIFLIFVISILFFTACEDLEEVDLSRSHIQLNAPSDKLSTDLTSLTFWWDSISNVQSYNLQIVSKSFTQIEKVILDTTVKKNKVYKKLGLGTYQWRVSARNLNSVTYSDTFSFSIDTAKTSLIKRVALRGRFYEIHSK